MKKVKKPVKDFSREKRRHHQAKNIEMLNQFIYDERKYFFAEMCRLSKEKSVVPPKKLFYEWWSSRASITERSFLGQSHQKMPFRKICLEYELAHNQSFVSFLVSGDQIYTWMPVEKRVDSSEVRILCFIQAVKSLRNWVNIRCHVYTTCHFSIWLQAMCVVAKTWTCQLGTSKGYF